MRTLGFARRVIPRAEIVGGTVTEKRLLRQILRGLYGPPLLRLRLDLRVEGRNRTSWISVLTSPSDRPANLRSRWQALLLIGAFRDQMKVVRLPTVEGFTIATLGAGKDDDRRRFRIRPSSRLLAASLDANALPRQIEAEAKAAGLELDSIALLRPLGAAVSISAQLDRPATYLKVLTRLGFAETRRPIGDGLFAEIHDRSGRVIIRYGFANRLRATVAWVDPKLLRRY